MSCPQSYTRHMARSLGHVYDPLRAESHVVARAQQLLGASRQMRPLLAYANKSSMFASGV
jgi:hypothetical protein